MNNGESSALYARNSRTTLNASPEFGAGPSCMAAREDGEIVGFKTGKRRIEHFPARHNNNVRRRSDLVAPEKLACKPLRFVPYHRGSEPAGSSHAKPQSCSRARHDEYPHITASDPNTCLVGMLKIRPPLDPFRRRQSLAPHLS